MGRSPNTPGLIALLTLNCLGFQAVKAQMTVCHCHRDSGSSSSSRCYKCPCAGDDQCALMGDTLECIFSEDRDSMPCGVVLMKVYACTMMNFSCPGSSSAANSVCGCSDRNTSSRCYQCDCDNDQQCQTRLAILGCILTESSDSDTCKMVLDMMCSRTQEASCEGEDAGEEESQASNPPPTDPQPPPTNPQPPPSPPMDPQPPPSSPTNPQSQSSQSLLIGIVVPVVICVTIIIVIIVIAIMLALYWKFRIKVIRGKNSTAQPTNSYTLNSLAKQQTQGEPLYSVIDTPGYTEPPKLPPSRVPYYQKIESDMIDTAAVVEYDQPPTDKMADYEQPTRKMGTVADYEQPMTKLNKNSSTKHNDIIQHNNDMRVEPYQEPIDALQGEV